MFTLNIMQYLYTRISFISLSEAAWGLVPPGKKRVAPQSSSGKCHQGRSPPLPYRRRCLLRIKCWLFRLRWIFLACLRSRRAFSSCSWLSYIPGCVFLALSSRLAFSSCSWLSRVPAVRSWLCFPGSTFPPRLLLVFLTFSTLVEVLDDDTDEHVEHEEADEQQERDKVGQPPFVVIRLRLQQQEDAMAWSSTRYTGE